MYKHIIVYGDGIKDVVFEVDNVAALYSSAVERGAVGIKKPYVLNNKYSFVELATIRAFDKTTYTFVNYRNYKRIFLPSFKEVKTTDLINDFLLNIKFEVINYFIGN
jgi:4-hydroxyphenylpyruvate dioxygenase